MKLRDFMVADQFHKLVAGLGHDALGLILTVEKNLDAVGAPNISWRMDTAETGLIRGLTGKRRDFLVIDSPFPEYRVLVSSRSYGTALQVSWILMASTVLANEVKRVFRLMEDRESRFDIGAELDVFDMIDLNAFIGITRMAVLKAISQLTADTEAEETDRVSPLD